MADATSTLGKLGVDYNSLPASAQSQVMQNVGAGRMGSDAAVQAMADSLPVRVPLTSGQMSGEPGQQLEENLTLRGARGAPAQIIAKGFQQQQQSALRGNVDQIGANIGGGFPTARGQAGEDGFPTR